MNLSEQTFLDLLIDVEQKSTNQKFYSLKKNDLGYLNAIQMSHLYISSALLVTMMAFLKEQVWLKNKEDNILESKTSYHEFISPFFLDELLPVLFLKDFLTLSGEKNIRKIGLDSQNIESKILTLITNRSNSERKTFVIHSLVEMNIHFLLEEKKQNRAEPHEGHQGPQLYRTFDKLDVVLNLDYQLDRDMVIDHSAKERLYAGSGVGVQSGYSTILLALSEVNLKKAAKVIDLGSGYGRVGLVCSLLRPDIDFVGYEFVPHRVEIGNKASTFLGLEKSLSFKVQDLSLEDFKIPQADVYYLYDPFTKETYHHVLNQILSISKTRKISIVTKGNARGWLMEIAKKNSWPDAAYLDGGNLCVFRSE
jgi:hypothetical protein